MWAVNMSHGRACRKCLEGRYINPLCAIAECYSSWVFAQLCWQTGTQTVLSLPFCFVFLGPLGYPLWCLPKCALMFD